MAGIREYINQFADKTFEEYPFNDSDALALSEIIYMPFEKVVSRSFDAEPRNYAVAANELFALHGFKHKKLGLMITNHASINMMATANTKRFSAMRIVAVQEVYSVKPAIQYCAGTFILPDGTLICVFRGTDDTIAGWKEDLDLFTHKNPPAYPMALKYIETLADKFDGDIIICGHSKGGNLALMTALRCSDKVRARIKGVYNNDGPGFHDYGIFHLGTYEEILPVYKHYVPSSSFIGMMMAHDYDYKAVKSTKHLGPFQHDVGTWKIKDGELETVPDIDILAKITDAALAIVCSYADDKACKAVDNIVTAFTDGLGQANLTDTAKHALSAVGGAFKAVKDISPDVKDSVKEAFQGAGKQVFESVKSIRGSNIAELTEKAFSVISR